MLGLAQHVTDQEAHGAGAHVDRRARTMALLQQVQQAGLNLLVAEQIRAAVVMVGQLAQRRQASLLGARSKAAQRHRIDHALAQRCQRRLQGPGTIPSTQATTHIPSAPNPSCATTASAVWFNGGLSAPALTANATLLPRIGRLPRPRYARAGGINRRPSPARAGWARPLTGSASASPHCGGGGSSPASARRPSAAHRRLRPGTARHRPATRAHRP